MVNLVDVSSLVNLVNLANFTDLAHLVNLIDLVRTIIRFVYTPLKRTGSGLEIYSKFDMGGGCDDVGSWAAGS